MEFRVFCVFRGSFHVVTNEIILVSPTGSQRLQESIRLVAALVESHSIQCPDAAPLTRLVK